MGKVFWATIIAGAISAIITTVGAFFFQSIFGERIEFYWDYERSAIISSEGGSEAIAQLRIYSEGSGASGRVDGFVEFDSSAISSFSSDGIPNVNFRLTGDSRIDFDAPYLNSGDIISLTMRIVSEDGRVADPAVSVRAAGVNAERRGQPEADSDEREIIDLLLVTTATALLMAIGLTIFRGSIEKNKKNLLDGLFVGGPKEAFAFYLTLGGDLELATKVRDGIGGEYYWTISDYLRVIGENDKSNAEKIVEYFSLIRSDIKFRQKEKDIIAVNEAILRKFLGDEDGAIKLIDEAEIDHIFIERRAKKYGLV